MLIWVYIPMIIMVILLVEHAIQYKRKSRELSMISEAREGFEGTPIKEVLRLQKGLVAREMSFLLVGVYLLLWLAYSFDRAVQEAINVWYCLAPEGPSPEVWLLTIELFATNVTISLSLVGLCVILYVLFAFWRKKIVTRAILELLVSGNRDDN